MEPRIAPLCDVALTGTLASRKGRRRLASHRDDVPAADGGPRDRAARPRKAVSRGPSGRRRLARDRSRRVLLAARPVRVREDDDAPDDRRLRAADGRDDPGAWA